MRKLKLESLLIQSFATTAVAPVSRGTVQAHQDPTADCLLSRDGGCISWDPAVCMETGHDCGVVTGEASCLIC